MTMPDATALILGGGAAGLQLGAALAEAGVNAAIIEPRHDYVSDRTWSFWAEPDHPFADCELGRWSRWSVAHGDHYVARQSETLVYISLDAGRVYDRLTSIIDQSDCVTLHRGISAYGTPERRDGPGRWQVMTDQGPLTARYVFDSRPPLQTRPVYGQYFLGHEIKTNSPCFNPKTAQLMHFRPHPDGTGVDFLYTLPFSDCHALIEVTRFTAIPPDEDQMADWLAREVQNILGDTEATLIRAEAGFLPMRVTSPPDTTNTPGYLPIGLAGGAARASTGYAFNRMGLAARALAGQVADDHPNPAIDLDGAMSRWMDRVFLSVIERNPTHAPGLFTQLFQNVPTDRLERFLEGSKQASDRLAIMRALPIAPFLKAAMIPPATSTERAA